MFINPNTFSYIEHFTPRQREKIASIVYSLARNYQAWLGIEDAIQSGHIGVINAYKRYGKMFVPQNADGYIRHQLKVESDRKQRFVDSREKNGLLDVLIIDANDYNVDCVDYLTDIKALLKDSEYDIFVRAVMLEQKLTNREKALFKSVLTKIRGHLYV